MGGRLVLTRRVGESVMIGDRIKLTVLPVKNPDKSFATRFRIEADLDIKISQKDKEKDDNSDKTED